MTLRIAPRQARRALISRIVAAVVGGYLLSSVFSIFLSYLLPSSLPEAVLGATLFSFAIYTAAVVWGFAAPSATRAWGGLLIPGLAMGVLSFGMHVAGGAP